MLPEEAELLDQQITMSDNIQPLIESGKVSVVSPVHEFVSDGVKLKSGEVISVDSVVCATGYVVCYRTNN